jgi:hypothetical protein
MDRARCTTLRRLTSADVLPRECWEKGPHLFGPNWEAVVGAGIGPAEERRWRALGWPAGHCGGVRIHWRCSQGQVPTVAWADLRPLTWHAGSWPSPAARCGSPDGCTRWGVVEAAARPQVVDLRISLLVGRSSMFVFTVTVVCLSSCPAAVVYSARTGAFRNACRRALPCCAWGSFSFRHFRLRLVRFYGLQWDGQTGDA